jgi:transcriptional regulator with XRE-family HTH domain
MTSEVMAPGRIAPYRWLMPDTDTAPAVGPLLRHWRATRRLSQLDLALGADVSSRHLSYVETGRSKPSRDMVLRLAEALEVPLRERNALLAAAGFAPAFFETSLESPAMEAFRSAIDLILAHQEPYPAFVLDRHWEIRRTNTAAERCTRFLLGKEPAESNMLRLVLGPGGLGSVLMSWEETAGDLVRHLHAQVAAAPTDARARALLDEVLGYPGIPAGWRTRDIGAPVAPLLTTVFRKDGITLSLFSAITTFGSPHDVTLDELRIECSFPADPETDRVCREKFGRA